MEILLIALGFFSLICLLIALPFILIAMGISEFFSALPYIIATVIVFFGIALAFYILANGTKAILDKIPTVAKWLGLAGKSFWILFIAIPITLALCLFLLSLILSPFVMLIATAENPFLICTMLFIFIGGCAYFAVKEPH